MKNKEIISRIKEMVNTLDISYIDAVIELSEKENIEIENIAAIIRQSTKIKSEIKEEAIKNKMVKDEKGVESV